MYIKATPILLSLTLALPPLLLVGNALGQGCEGKEASPNTYCVNYKGCDGVGQPAHLGCPDWEWVDPYPGYYKCQRQWTETDECNVLVTIKSYAYGDCILVGSGCIEDDGFEGDCDFMTTAPCGG